MRSGLRRPAVALVATSLAAGLLGVVPAAHAVDGIVAGVVSGPDGGIANAYVDLYQYDADLESWSQVHAVGTDADGAYAIVVPAGRYRLGFSDPSGDHAFEYHGNAIAVDAPDAEVVTVPASGTVEVGAELEPGAHLTGHVTDAGGAGLGDIRVFAYRVVDRGDHLDYDEVGVDLTAADGSYDLGGLVAGTYRVGFDDGWWDDATSTYATEHHPDRSSLDGAADVRVEAAQTRSGIDAELAPDSQISGRVTDARGAGVGGATIDALVRVGREWHYAGYAWSGPDGGYVLDGLPAGTYRVEFRATIGDDAVYEFWNDADRLADARDVVLRADAAATDVDAELVAEEGDDEAGPTVTNTSRPTISGTAAVGQPLIAGAGSWTPMPTGYSYDWLRGGEAIDGADGPMYVPTAEDLGKRITVVVSAGAPDHGYGSAESGPTAAVVAASLSP